MGRRNNATPFSGYTVQKEGSHCYVGPFFEPLFTTQPFEVWSTSPWTLFAAMLRGPLSHPICRQTIAFCERDSRCTGCAILSSLSPFQQMCHLIPWLTLATNCTGHVIIPSMHRTSRSGHTPRLKYHVHPSPQHVATYQVDLPVLNFSSWKVTFPQFPSFSHSFCARRINATRESLFQSWPDVTARPPLYGG